MAKFRGLVCVAVVLVCGSLLWAKGPKGADNSGKDLPNSDFTNQNLENATFEDSVLTSSRFDKSVVINVNFQGADLSRCSFAQCDLTKADFRGARLAYTSFFMATMNEARLDKADLSMNGGLSQVKFRKANLQKLKAIGSVADCDFTEADLRGANLINMKFVGGPTRFRKAIYDSKTRWPKNFDVEASGAVLGKDLDEEEEKKEDKDDDAKPEPKDGDEKDVDAEFSKLDVNEDGRLTGKEMKGLESLDANKDGRITLQEFRAGQK
jgi:uncharacterized protein YjbI with pentapeptide repeats